MRPSSSSPAFTIIELLVSMTVLTLLIVMVSQMVSSATAVTTSSRKHIDADGQARLIFDRLGGDLAKMVKRSDVDYIFSKQTGNDKMFFYSESPAFYSGAADAASPLALVGWRINASSQMERLGKQLSWDGPASALPGGMVFLTYPAPTTAVPSPTPYPASQLDAVWASTVGASPSFSGTSDDYHMVSDSVCRLEYCFQNTDGTYTNGPATTRSLSGYSAIVVALVILDPQSRQIASPATVGAAFTDPTDLEITPGGTTPPKLMATSWEDKLKAGIPGIPQAASSQIRIYQRYFYLNAK
ncbi:MAG: hypothetical protein ABIT76_00025 [Chthoniobacterales bacterium]